MSDSLDGFRFDRFVFPREASRQAGVAQPLYCAVGKVSCVRYSRGTQAHYSWLYWSVAACSRAKVKNTVKYFDDFERYWAKMAEHRQMSGSVDAVRRARIAKEIES
ncbi:MAG: hypothetical protein KDH88_08630 [Chromatiales bacterium]|nr:hypothetical protein [Chromatiales bacterium]